MGISKYLVADAWFSKKPFTDQITELGMHLVSRLRDDADLRYLYTGSKTGKQGRPPKYAGKVNNHKIDTEYFKLISLDNESIYIFISMLLLLPLILPRRSTGLTYQGRTEEHFQCLILKQ